MGGEEFGILLPGMDDAQAGAFLDDLLATGSVGLALMREGDTLAETIRRADEAPYAAKRAGKERWHAPAQPGPARAAA